MRYSLSTVSDIKLIRTDTTLDLSHEAEKRYQTVLDAKVFYINVHRLLVVSTPVQPNAATMEFKTLPARTSLRVHSYLLLALSYT